MSPAKLALRAMRPALGFSRPLSTTARLVAATSKSEKGEMDVGEMEGAKFRVEPLRRTGEDANTMRARLVYQSRKRGTLESDLLMSTFADTHLPSMSMAQMAQYDLFLDENDWDIYYWATQEPGSAAGESADSEGSRLADATRASQSRSMRVAQGTDAGKQSGPELETDEWRQGKPRSGEWAQTIGTFKPAHRPVPARWKNSEILALLRRHVIDRSAGGVHAGTAGIGQEAEGVSVRGSGRGMAFMPKVRNMDVF